MLTRFIENADWNREQLQLIRDYHLEWGAYFKERRSTWRALMNAQAQQRHALAYHAYRDRAALLTKQIEETQQWRIEGAIMKQAIIAHHEAERNKLGPQGET
ncbi:hypothetical protein [Fibrivirga algicola]|uniref:Flagellar FliJ protein n=1 Tax=Fibrivirga algicola TaxID=2950420 RepID=A0ABX0QMS4_9BACT|nr:hypothetical protein [Fibrivirga algicola]NID13795.1 hypothetical protein [Fibrivirga algicola]